ncbi:MAG: sugar phosphate nucleotidyltransferase [Bryobacterales bacterium]|nr:sugar phosphate nucleotidyltransferase [Bryobacterales bacterium]
MDCPISKAVVPVAGLGTRLLPATKSQPKEMLPVARKPIVQYVVEELARNGVRNLLFVTGRGKAAIENHFDTDPALMDSLRKAGKDDLLLALDFEKLGLNVLYTRQSVQRGLGDAILHGESFAGEQPFIVALGDSIIGLHGNSMVCQRMADAFVREQADVVIAVEEVEPAHVRFYGIVEPHGEGEVFGIRTMVEKPTPDMAPSRLAVSGRYVFGPGIFDMIRQVKPDKRGEIQITDAIRAIAEGGGKVVGVKLRPEEKRYDIGNMPSYFETFLEFALADPDYGGRVRTYLRRVLAE